MSERAGLRIIAAGLAAVLALSLGGCAPVAPGQGPSTPYAPKTTSSSPKPSAALARVAAVQGPNAFVVHLGQTSQAQVNQPIYQGDRFFTGASSKLKLTLAQGGDVTLDELTDPGLFTDIQCLYIRLFDRGALYVSGKNVCVENGPNIVGQQSAVTYRVLMPGGGKPVLRITVLSGMATTIQPPGVVIRAGYQADLRNGQLVSGPAPASAADQRAATSWIKFPSRGSVSFQFSPSFSFGGRTRQPRASTPTPPPPPPPTPVG